MDQTVNKPDLSSLLATLELDRKVIAATQKKGYLFIGAAIVFLIVVIFMSFPLGIILPIGLAIYGFIILNKISDSVAIYEHRFKTEVIGSALKSVDESLLIEANSGISPSEFDVAQLFTKEVDRYHTEDLVSGKIDKTSFYFAEVHAEYERQVQTKNGTRTEWYDIFKGIIFVADFNKNFNGVTVVRPKDLSNSMGAWFSKNLFSFSDKQSISLENTEFDRTFVTYGTDQVEARYILSLALMERILMMNKNCGSTVSLSFLNSKMYIAFPLDRDYFEAPIFSSLLDPDLLNLDINTVNFMCSIVNELDLNTRIWTKA